MFFNTNDLVNSLCTGKKSQKFISKEKYSVKERIYFYKKKKKVWWNEKFKTRLKSCIKK